MGTNRFRRFAISRVGVLALTVIPLVARFAFSGLANISILNPGPKAGLLTNSLPARITTTDGVTYQLINLVRVEPDGLVIEFRSGAGGAGLARLKFAKLPVTLQKQFGYDPQKAADYENERGRMMQALSRKWQEEDATRTRISAALARPNLARFVSVKRSEPTVTYAYYGPGPKPPQVGDHTGTTEHQFKCQTELDLDESTNGRGRPIQLEIKAITISLELSFRITAPERDRIGVKAHEDAHRKIYEHFYDLAPKVAQHLGENLIGWKYSPASTNLESAEAETRLVVQNTVEQDYLAQIDTPARAANRRFDELTDHGRNNLDPAQAAAEVIAKNDLTGSSAPRPNQTADLR
ncbi:MAG TPA: hypothetical protein VMB80_02465 [Candidatus Acidoferrum sp.]|nr:hypothetical protein [Candidatus Acidoferrum sp.]